ncbi:MAG TPA: helix-turn-helix transcriptional regulator [Capillimicrobium sp.]|jgi:DNA-binding PadR family transcriptional regulator
MLSTKHVVLGLVIERAGYGYDLQQRIGQRLGFLGLSDNVIYGVLDRLEREGLIEERGAKETGRTRRGSPRVTYVATAAGVAEFERWMASPSRPALLREELHAKLAVSAPEHLGFLVELTEGLELEYLRELQALAGARRGDVDDPDLDWASLVEVLVEEAQATRIEGTIAWLQRTRAILERRMAAPAEHGRR